MIEIPRCCSSSIQSEVALRRSPLAFTDPAPEVSFEEGGKDTEASVAELQWNAYQEANKAFTEVVMGLEPSEGDMIWVQDYHLMLARGSRR